MRGFCRGRATLKEFAGEGYITLEEFAEERLDQRILLSQGSTGKFCWGELH